MFENITEITDVFVNIFFIKSMKKITMTCPSFEHTHTVTFFNEIVVFSDIIGSNKKFKPDGRFGLPRQSSYITNVSIYLN